jgi:hypothetical protein
MDLKRASHGEVNSYGVSDRFGGIPNWGSLVSDWRHEWVDWMLEYLAELRVCSIYRIHERW